MVEYEDIRKIWSGADEQPRFLIHHGGLIMALCLIRERHPRIFSTPAEVWIEAGPLNEQWGERLAMDTGAVPLYVATHADTRYREIGVFHVIDSTTDPLDLAQRMAYPCIPKLARLIFLSGPHSI